MGEWENGRMGKWKDKEDKEDKGDLGEKKCILFTYYLLLITYYLNLGWGNQFWLIILDLRFFNSIIILENWYNN